MLHKSEGGRWEIALLEYLMTPIRHQGDKSPLILMQSCTVQGILPVRKEESNSQDLQNFKNRRQEQKQYYDQGFHNLDTLKEHWSPGIVVKNQLITKGG